MDNFKRKPLDFNSFPSIIKEMSENDSNAATVIDELIELKGENISLAILILLDDMNIRGIQLFNLYKMCHQDIEKFYNKITNIKEEDINYINHLSASLTPYKAVFQGTCLNRFKFPYEYLFSNQERVDYIKCKFINQPLKTTKHDLYPDISIEEALKIITDYGFMCGYSQEYFNNHNKEIYQVFYNKKGDILYTTSLENKDIFLWKDSKLIHPKSNTLNEIELKDAPFETYENLLKQEENKPYNYTLLPVIKNIGSLKYQEQNHNYISSVTAHIYNLLTFEQTYEYLDNGLKKLYAPLLKTASDKAYDEIIKNLKNKDGLEIAINLQDNMNYNLSKSKLFAAKERFCKSHGHSINHPKKRFLCQLFLDDPYIQNINTKIIDILDHKKKIID